MMSPFSLPDNITGAHLSTIFPLKSMTHFFWSMASFLLNAAAAGESRQAHILLQSHAGYELRWVEIKQDEVFCAPTV